MERHSKELSKGRKKRVMPAGLASAQEIETLSLISSHPLHKSTKVWLAHVDGSLMCAEWVYTLAFIPVCIVCKPFQTSVLTKLHFHQFCCQREALGCSRWPAQPDWVRICGVL